MKLVWSLESRVASGALRRVITTRTEEDNSRCYVQDSQLLGSIPGPISWLKYVRRCVPLGAETLGIGVVMSNKVFRFDGESWCVVFCRPNSDIVQMTSNIPDEKCATSHVERLRADGYHVFRTCKAGVLIAALELIKTQAPEESPHTTMDNECGTCGIGFRLPSGRCDHCDVV